MKKLLILCGLITTLCYGQNLKISQLPSATTPLAGTELAPIVQNGITKKVPVTYFGVTGGVGNLGQVLTNGNNGLGLAINNVSTLSDGGLLTSIDIDNRYLYNSTSHITLGWDSQILFSSAGSARFNWNTLTFPTLAGNGIGEMGIDNSGNISWIAKGASKTGSPNQIRYFNAAGRDSSDSQFTHVPGGTGNTQIKHINGSVNGEVLVSNGQALLSATTATTSAIVSVSTTQTGVVFTGATNTSTGVILDNSDMTIINYNNSWKYPHSFGAAHTALVDTDGTGTLVYSTVINSGHFAVVYSDSSNIDAISDNIDAAWTRVGNIVTVQYSVNVDATTTLTDTYSEFTLPVTASPSSSLAGQGGFGDSNSIVGSVIVIPTDGTHAIFHLKPVITTNALVQFTITYRAN